MANNPGDGTNDDFLEQMLVMQTYSAAAAAAGGDPNLMPPNVNLAGTPTAPMLLHLSSGDMGGGGNGGGFQGPVFPLGLSLEQGNHSGFLKHDDGSASSSKRFREEVLTNKNVFHGQPIHTNVPVAPHPPPVRPRVRARRGQATDPHSIAERLRRERIAERIRALQELVPSVNKTDRAAMLDEIVDYVKFLRLQVKVLSMSRLGGAGAVAPLVTDVPVSSLEEEGGEGGGGRNQPAWEKWSNDGTERQVAKLMEENVGAAMQFLQSKALCIMPISLASAIYHTHQPSDTTNTSSLVKPETNPLS